MAIDPNAMYKAGFSSKSTGRNTENDNRAKREEFWRGVGKQAYNVLGTAAIGQMKQNYKGLQAYRNAADSQIGLNTLQVSKMPKDNQGLKDDIALLGQKFAQATKAAHYGFGKKRAKGRQDAAMYMKQLHDMNAVLTTIADKRVSAQGMVGVASGKTQANDKQPNMSSGASQHAVGNTISLAEGSLGQRIRWNTDKGQMEVQVGGEWKQDERGNNVYSNKSETGTYEDYLAEDSEVNSKLDKKYEKYTNEESGTGVSDRNVQSREDWNKSQNIEPTDSMSEEDWTANNQENLGLVSMVAYSNLKFAEEEDKTFGTDLQAYDKLKVAQASKKGSLSWENVELNEKEEFFAKIDEYSDLQFRDYFFGGGTFERSSTRMSNTAPAFLFLKEEDKRAGNLEDDGSFKKGFGPGNKDWEGRLLSLRGQSFVSGSQYRKTTADQQWEKIGEKYKRNQRAYKDANPEKGDESLYYQISLQDGAGASNVAKSQVDPIVRAFNNASDKAIIPLQAASHMGMQWGKDNKGFYAMVPQYTTDDQGRKIKQASSKVRGTKDEIASVLRINDPMLGYNFTQRQRVDYDGDGKRDNEPVPAISFVKYTPDANKEKNDGTEEKPLPLPETLTKEHSGMWFTLKNGKVKQWIGEGGKGWGKTQVK